MEHQAIRYKLTPREMSYFLFAKKVCPQCGTVMTRQKGYVTVKGAELKEESDMFFRHDANVKDYKFFFVCKQCNIQYSLTELANQNRRG